MRQAVAARFQMFSALRFREFRYYWMGLTVQIVGQQMFMLSLGWLAFDLSGSMFQLGVVNGFGAIPRVALVLFGGVLADRMDQRKLIVGAQLISGAVMVALATLTVMDAIEIWHLAAASFVVGIAQSIDEPSRTAFFPRLLPERSHIASAVPLMALAWSSTRIIAPSVAGFVIAAFGAGTSFFLSAMGAAAMVAAIQVVRPFGVQTSARGNVFQNLIDGVRFVRNEDVFFKIISVAFIHATFAMGYVLMLPVFAEERLGVGATGLGLLASATGVGSVIGLLTFHWLHSRLNPGSVIVMGLTLFAVACIAFALSSWFFVSLGMLTLVGAGHTYYQTSAQIVLQTLVPQELRGRVMSLYGMLWSLMLVGGTLLNMVAEVVGPQAALTGGCTIVLLYVWLFVARSPTMRNLSLTPAAEPAGRAE
jgi:MFS family permease